MSALTDELRTLLDGSNGEALDVPHPNQIKDVRITPMTRWHRAERAGDYENNEFGAPAYTESGERLTYVTGQVQRMQSFDEYQEPIGEPEYLVAHKVTNPKIANKDTATTPISAFTCRDLRKRFPGALAEFEAKMVRDGVDLPIALLDDVPPHVITHIRAKGGNTVQAFAAFTKKQTDELKASLEASKMHARIPYVERYKEMAQAKIGQKVAEAA